MANTAELLRPGQVSQLQDEASRLEHALSQPHLQDRPAATRALRHTEHQLNTMVPQPYSGEELDTAVSRVAELKRAMIEDGMPTRKEMRENRPGAVGKLRRWERLHKTDLLEWKHRQLRLNAGTDDPDVANFERFRPAGGSGELAQEGAQIVGKEFYFGPNAGHPATVFDDAEVAALKAVAPTAAEMLPTLDGDMRQQLKDIVREMLVEQVEGRSDVNPQPADVEPAKDPPKALQKAAKKTRKKRNWTPEQRTAFGEKMKAHREAKKAAAT